ncbi:hypothetical protein VOLCADRAFT_88294 [Volvox carteri f. nagariensis]|uniref:Uncharacterized protein n=1 Tax=Volvox carteri f. nagariensis TaxID=3068 RepID=D8TNT7_VOLCA|nr:uncharacterized protein VOLCADRAFT_88294 [Volvox carteri f. nagariensis]EFJ50898.1 hypothetical protein VOLCADRAFT_88294 [Volvox carteri f. nagariensis]|eukprot:XP_002947910.1 hypothetical protein VOLCADRAFT_88294 [Volvox carteri f. nagariensis]
MASRIALLLSWTGVLFFFIMIAGLSFGVHQLLTYIGAGRGEQQLAQPFSRQVAVVTPVSRSRHLQPPSSISKPEASVEEPAASSSAAALGAAVGVCSTEDGGSNIAVNPGPQGDTKAGGVTAASAAQNEIEAAGTRSSGGPGTASSALADASEIDTGGEVETESENIVAGQSGEVAVQQPAPGPSLQPSAVASTADRASNSNAAKAPQPVPMRESGPLAAVEAAGRAVGGQGSQGAPGPAAFHVPVDMVEPSALEDSTPQAAPEAAAQVLHISSPNCGAGSSGSFGGLRGRLAAPAEQVLSAPGPSSNIEGRPRERTASSFGDASAFPLGPGSPGPAASVAPQAEPRMSLPTVLPEPLSRAPDSSALERLPSDSSLGSLRERAQLALRAAAAAVEASQRAAAYAAAASNAASRAAEAAERAATAATLAQAGLESAAESAIVAAEARVAQAAEAAKDAEADIAQYAATVQKPAAPGPLSQLQQLWRSASSAFTHGHQQSQRDGSSEELSGASTTAGIDSAGSGTRRDRTAPDDAGGSASGGNVGVAAAETISSTVKGLLSWLGQGDGTR